MFGEIKWIERIPGYHYYDSPEDSDCFKKVVFMNKMGLLFGTFAGTVDIIMISKPVGFADIAGRYGVITLPIMATGSAYAAATCLSAYYRGKIDYVNSTIGGFVAGCTLGGVLRNGVMGTYASLFFAALAYGMKSTGDMGFKYMPDDNEVPPLNFGGIWSIKMDYTLTKERPKGWKSGDE